MKLLARNLKLASQSMDNSNYMDNVLQTFLLIQSSPDELQVGMVDTFLNNQVNDQVIGAFSDLMGAMVTYCDPGGQIEMEIFR